MTSKKIVFSHVTKMVDQDKDGWWFATCQCRWTTGPVPDLETLVDAWGDHVAVVTLHEARATV